MIFVLDDFPEWTFEAEERSVSVYRGTATDRMGRSVAATAFTEEELFRKLKDYIREMQKKEV